MSEVPSTAPAALSGPSTGPEGLSFDRIKQGERAILKIAEDRELLRDALSIFKDLPEELRTTKAMLLLIASDRGRDVFDSGAYRHFAKQERERIIAHLALAGVLTDEDHDQLEREEAKESASA